MKKLWFACMLLGTMTACVDDGLDPNGNTADYYVGSWSCQENSSLYGQSIYSVTIEKDPVASNTLIIHNFYNDNLSILCNSGENDLEIPLQEEGGFQVQGSGLSTSDHESISFTYIVNDGVENDNCSATFVKQ